MKLKYIILLIVIGTVSFVVYQDKNLQSKLVGKAHQVIPELNSSTLYKWKNNDDEWQITDKPPKTGIKYSTVTSQEQVNIMPSHGKSEEKK